MTNYRDDISYEGSSYFVPMESDGVTILYDATKQGNSAAYGLACTISANGTVALAGDGDPVFGKVGLVEADGKVAVEKGIVTLPGGASATLTAGKPIIGDLGASSAKGYIQNAVTTATTDVAVGRGEILDASTTTAVVVSLP